MTKIEQEKLAHKMLQEVIDSMCRKEWSLRNENKINDACDLAGWAKRLAWVRDVVWPNDQR